MIKPLKTLFKTQTLLYKLFFHINKKNLSKGIRLPKKGDDFYFEGYPRSGNTYVYNLIKSLNPETESCSHLHVVAGLKIAKTLSIPSIVIIRKPEDAIASNFYTQMNKKENRLENAILTEVIEDWIVFYSYVLKIKYKAHIISFDKFLNDKYSELNKVAHFLKMDDLNPQGFDEVLKKNDDKMKMKENNKEISYSSLPSGKREEFKRINKEKIINHPKFQMALNIYNQF